MDMGRDEPTTRESRYLVWGEGNEGKGHDAIQEHQKDSNGLRESYVPHQEIHLERSGADEPQFETQEWSLEMEDGTKVYLLDEKRPDPFKNTALEAET